MTGRPPYSVCPRAHVSLAFRAMAEAHLGHIEKARADLGELEKLVLPLPLRTPLSAIVTQLDAMAVCLAYEEAKAVLSSHAAPKP